MKKTLILVTFLISLLSCTKETVKGDNQYVLFHYAFKTDGSQEIKDDFVLTSVKDSIVNYGMSFIPSKDGKIFMLGYKMPSPPSGTNDVVLYLVDMEENKILYSKTITYVGTGFYNLDLTNPAREISVQKNKSYMVCYAIPIQSNNNLTPKILDSFRIYKHNQSTIVPFVQKDITVTGFYKKTEIEVGIPNVLITDTNILYGLLDISYYSIE